MLNTILLFYKLRFHSLYNWQIKMKSLSPDFSALSMLSVSIWLNIINLNIALHLFLPIDVFLYNLTPVSVILTMIIIMIVNYFSLINNGRLKRINKEFENHSQEKIRSENKITTIYMILTFILFPILNGLIVIIDKL